MNNIIDVRNEFDELLLITIHFLLEHDTFNEMSLNELFDFVDRIQNYIRKKHEVKK